MNGRLKCIVFSRDRAMQLDAFLASVELHVPALFDEVAALYRATDDLHGLAYTQLVAARPDTTWVAEASFRDDLLSLRGAEDQLVFHTDDDVLRAGAALRTTRRRGVFLAATRAQHVLLLPARPGGGVVQPTIGSDRVSWERVSQGVGDFSYPLALNGHVFRAAEAHEWLASVEYATPNELETTLQSLNDHQRPRMASLPHSVVVSIPANIVNETWANRHAPGNDIDELNARFLEGTRIDLGGMDFQDVTACHQEIPFAFLTPRCGRRLWRRASLRVRRFARDQPIKSGRITKDLKTLFRADVTS